MEKKGVGRFATDGIGSGMHLGWGGGSRGGRNQVGRGGAGRKGVGTQWWLLPLDLIPGDGSGSPTLQGTDLSPSLLATAASLAIRQVWIGPLYWLDFFCRCRSSARKREPTLPGCSLQTPPVLLIHLQWFYSAASHFGIVVYSCTFMRGSDA